MKPIYSSYRPYVYVEERSPRIFYKQKQQSTSSSFPIKYTFPIVPFALFEGQGPLSLLFSATQDAPTQPTPLPSRSPESQEAEACQRECSVRDNVVCLKKPDTKNFGSLLRCLALPIAGTILSCPAYRSSTWLHNIYWIPIPSRSSQPIPSHPIPSSEPKA